jgi:hypothetical protein
MPVEPLLERRERFVIGSTGQRLVLDRRRHRMTIHHLSARCRLRSSRSKPARKKCPHCAKAQNRFICRAAGTAAARSGRWLRPRTTQAADQSLRNAGHAIAMVHRPNLPDAPQNGAEPSACQAAGTAAVGSGRWLRTRTTLAADQPVRSAGHAIARAERKNLPDAPEIRGNLPPRQTKLSTRRHSGSTPPEAEEPGFAADRSGVLRDTVLRTQIEAENPVRKTLIISQRFFAIPPSRFHALADGIHTIHPS